MLLLLSRVQDTLGRTSELAGVIPAQGEILWDLEDPAYVEVTCATGQSAPRQGREGHRLGVSARWSSAGADEAWDSPLALRGSGSGRRAARRRRDRFAALLAGHGPSGCGSRDGVRASSRRCAAYAADRGLAARRVGDCRTSRVACTDCSHRHGAECRVTTRRESGRAQAPIRSSGTTGRRSRTTI